MSNILIASRNRATSATLAGGNFHADWPRNNLKDDDVDKVARFASNAVADTRVRCDLGANYVLRALAFRKHNLSPNALWRARVGLAPFDVDFTGCGAIDERLTVTSDTDGTVVNEAGVIAAAPATGRIDHDPLDYVQALLYPEDFTNANWLQSGGASAMDFRTIAFTAATAQWLQTGLTIVAGAQYGCRGRVRCTDGIGTFKGKVYDGTSDILSTEITATSEFADFDVTVTAVASTGGAGNVSIYKTGGAGILQFERLQFYRVHATEATPYRKSTSTRIFRRKGLLIEEARTNLVLNSLLNGTNLSTQSVTLTAVAHTLSFYGTGTVTLSGASTAGPLVGTGAYPTRSTLTFTPSAGSVTFTVSGTVQFAMLEVGSFASSFVPTAGAAVARSADSAVASGGNFTSWYTQGSGAMLVEATTAANGTRVIASIDNGTVNEEIAVYANSTNARMYVGDGGAGQVDMSSGTITADTAFKIAAAWSTNDFATCLNGGAVGTDSAGTLPTPDRLQLGVDATAATICGCIKRFTYWPFRLTNSQLQTITTSGPDAIGYDSGWRNALEFTFQGDTPSDWGAEYDLMAAFDALLARYQTIEIHDTAHAGLPQLGWYFIAGGLQPTHNASFGGFRDGRDDSLSVVNKTSTGKKRGIDRERPRINDFALNWLTYAERDHFDEMVRLIGTLGACLIVRDPADMATSQRWSGVCTLRSLEPYEFPSNVPLRQSIAVRAEQYQ